MMQNVQLKLWYSRQTFERNLKKKNHDANNNTGVKVLVKKNPKADQLGD